jgi:polyisoprenoid-binding protein YceI
MPSVSRAIGDTLDMEDTMRQAHRHAGHRLAQLLTTVGTLAGLTPERVPGQEPIQPGRVSFGTLSFDGHATVGDFTGTSTALRGEISGGPSLESVRGWVETPVKSLRTGKWKRDADLNKSMESDKYPVIRYELDSVTPASIIERSAIVILHGRFSIHGVTRQADFPARVLLTPDGARVWADTPLNLKDYHIGGLSKMLGILRMHEEIQVHLDIAFASGETIPIAGK